MVAYLSHIVSIPDKCLCFCFSLFFLLGLSVSKVTILR